YALCFVVYYTLPYTTLFRSRQRDGLGAALGGGLSRGRRALPGRAEAPDRHRRLRHPQRAADRRPEAQGLPVPVHPRGRLAVAVRSEEHTSELQSRENLVCRL